MDRKVGESLQTRYTTLAQQAITDLLRRLFQLQLPLQQQQDYLALLPEIIDSLFPRLNSRQRKELMLELVCQMEAKEWIAFECVDRLLDT